MEENKIKSKTQIANIIRNIPEVEYVEYVFLDNEDDSRKFISNLDENDTYLLTLNNKNELYIIENSMDNNSSDRYDNTITSRPELDLIIITDDTKIQDNYIQEMVTKNTIITKIFDNDITYIEDNMSDRKILITECDTYTINGSGIKTRINKNQQKS